MRMYKDDTTVEVDKEQVEAMLADDWSRTAPEVDQESEVKVPDEEEVDEVDEVDHTDQPTGRKITRKKK